MAAGHLRPYPGVADLVHQLDSRGTLLALVTSSLKAEAELALVTFGLAHLFRVVVTAEDVANGKPAPDGYLLAARRLNVEPAGCIVIEDSPTGVRAAKAAAMSCVAVTNTHSPQQLHEATLIVTKLEPGCLDAMLNNKLDDSSRG